MLLGIVFKGAKAKACLDLFLPPRRGCSIASSQSPFPDSLDKHGITEMAVRLPTAIMGSQWQAVPCIREPHAARKALIQVTFNA